MLETSSTSTPLHDVSSDILSAEEKYVLYAVLQDIAQELRRIKREKHQKTQPD